MTSLTGRDDDNPETLHKRFVTYNKDTMPMVEHLENMGLLKRIDAKRTIDEVYAVSDELDRCNLLFFRVTKQRRYGSKFRPFSRRHDVQHNDTQHNDTQHNDIQQRLIRDI
jgi:hypothetical protein